MQPATVICATCGAQISDGSRYCPRCGEAVEAQLVAELRRLHGEMLTLDRLIGEGRGAQSIAEARAELLKRYLTLRRAPLEASAPGTSAQEPVVASPVAPVSTGATTSAATGGRQSAPQGDSTATAPRGPAFSWRAFVAEQAIAIMAYLGGFLLLVATLSFEVGGWRALGDGPKLAVVCVVYAAFGILGLVLRRSTRLRTVAGAYLGVFALMTPLVALAVYRFELQRLGFPAAGMLCVSAAYAAAIYLLLSARTGFATYAYLGWGAFFIAALSIVPWLEVSLEWELTALSLAAIALLLTRELPWMRTFASVHEAGERLAPLAALVAIGGTELVGLNLWGGEALSGLALEVAPFTWAALAIVPLTALWSRYLHGRTPPATLEALDVVDWGIAALSAQAILGIAALEALSRETLALLLAALALALLIVALALRQRLPGRAALRRGIEALGLVFTLIGAWSIQADAPPNGALILCLGVGALICGVAAFVEAATWLLVGAGVLLSLDYRAVLVALLPRSPATTTPFALDATLIVYFTGFALALWALGLIAGMQPRTRPYGGAIFAVALANALYVTAYLFTQDARLQTSVLCAFALAALIAGWRERQPLPGGVATTLFGLLAASLTTSSGDGVRVAEAMLIAGAVAVAARLLMGRTHAVAPYLVALWATIWGGIHLVDASATTAGWSVLGVSFAAWAIFGVAALATLAAMIEREPAGMTIPAALALWGVAETYVLASDGRSALVVFLLALALAGIGAVARAWRGRWWATAWQVAALVASVLAVLSLAPAIHHAAQLRVAEILIFAGITVLIAAQERTPAIGIVAVGYALTAVWLLPGPENLTPTLVMAFAAAGLGMALQASRREGLTFAAYSLYATAAGASLFAVDRVPGGDPGMTEALLLIFGAVAYVIAALERRPAAGLAPVLYIVWATLRQPDPHALLPIALGLCVLGVLLGRVGGLRWAWPAYLAAAVAGTYGAVLGRGDVGFEPYALLALALAVYVIAAVEARPELLFAFLSLGGLGLAAGLALHHAPQWMSVLAFAALGWVYYGTGLLWLRLPIKRGAAEEAEARTLPQMPERWRDARIAGMELQTWGGLLLSAVTVLVVACSAEGFTAQGATTRAVTGALVSLAALLGFHAVVTRRREVLYLSGATLSVAAAWLARALGADNVQAFVLEPGSYLLLAGALLPVDDQATMLRRAAPLCSMLGVGVLLLPTLGQSFASEADAIYALVLALEALVIVAVGVGTQTRILVLAGSAFVGAAALRGALVALTSGIPVPLVIGGLAALLLGGATALSLRARRDGEHADAKP